MVEGSQGISLHLEKNGRPCLKWCDKHNINCNSPPVAWLDAFKKSEGDANDYSASIISKWTSWSNAKAILGNIGLGGQYDNFEPFTVSEIKKHIVIYIFNGLNISPCVEYKFRSSNDDPVNGSDLCHDSFGKNASKRHKISNKYLQYKIQC